MPPARPLRARTPPAPARTRRARRRLLARRAVQCAEGGDARAEGRLPVGALAGVWLTLEGDDGPGEGALDGREAMREGLGR